MTNVPAGHRQIGLFIADAHRPYREAVRAELTCRHRDLAVVGAAGSVCESIARIEVTRPIVVLVGVHLADGPGVEVLHRLFPQPAVRFLAFGLSATATDALSMISGGALGYLPKSAPTSVLATAVRRACAGDAVISAPLAGHMLNLFHARRPETIEGTTDQLSNRAVDSNAPVDRLTREERAVLRLLGRGYQLDEIVEKLGMSGDVINNIMADIIQKTRIATSVF